MKLDTFIIHTIDQASGGGAEKILFYLQKQIKLVLKVISLKPLINQNKLGIKFLSLNINQKNLPMILISSFGLIKKFFFLKNRYNFFIHSHLSKSLYSSFIASFFLKIPHIHTEHSTYNRRREKPFLYFIEHLIYKSLHSIVCVSEATRHSLLSYMPTIDIHKTKVINNGVQLIPHQNRIYLNKKKFNILLLGSLTFHKGFDIFLFAASHLKDRINKISIVGCGPDEKKLRDLSIQLSINDIVKFEGYIDNPNSFIYEADLGVIPSRWEGFGLVAAEMRSSGLPILISNVVGLGDLFSSLNGVVTFVSESAESLRLSLSKLFDDLSDNKILVENVHSELKKYSRSTMIDNYEKYYKSIINKYKKNEFLYEHN